MKTLAFYLGLALLLTHQVDSIPNHEWRIVPVLRWLPDTVGEEVFVAAHIPIFVLLVAAIASLNLRTRVIAWDVVSAFLVVHALLHLAFSARPAYEFDAMRSYVLIYGAAACGAVYWLARWRQSRA